MKLFPSQLLALAALAVIAVPARATLIGDTVTFKLLYPDPATAFDTQSVQVQTGTGDAHDMGTTDDLLTVNPEWNKIFITFKRDADMASPTGFAGFSVTDIDETINGVVIETNIDQFKQPQFKWNWDGTKLAWDAHSVTVNWYYELVLKGEFFNITLLTDTRSPGSSSVPDTGASAALLALPLGALFALRRRIRK